MMNVQSLPSASDMIQLLQLVVTCTCPNASLLLLSLIHAWWALVQVHLRLRRRRRAEKGRKGMGAVLFVLLTWGMMMELPGANGENAVAANPRAHWSAGCFVAAAVCFVALYLERVLYHANMGFPDNCYVRLAVILACMAFFRGGLMGLRSAEREKKALIEKAAQLEGDRVVDSKNAKAADFVQERGVWELFKDAAPM